MRRVSLRWNARRFFTLARRGWCNREEVRPTIIPHSTNSEFKKRCRPTTAPQKSFCILHFALRRRRSDSTSKFKQFCTQKLDFVQQTRKFGKPNLTVSLCETLFASQTSLILHSAFCIPHSAFRTPHSALRAPRSPLLHIRNNLHRRIPMRLILDKRQLLIG